MTGAVIVRSGRGPLPEDVSTLASHGVASAHEAYGRRGLFEPGLRPVYPGAAIAGRAVTVLTPPGDNLMIHASIEHCRPGDVLVVATTEPCTDGMLGELFATQLRARGVQGVVIDAGARDIADLTRLEFPVWSRAIHAQGTNKRAAGSVNVPVRVGGQSVAPGDVIVADDDGVLCIPLPDSHGVAVQVRERAAVEAQMRGRFQEGELSIDTYGLRSVLSEIGVRYVGDQET